MRGDVEQLTERERAALRLLASGHDAKSIATALDLSVHTVNERLRAARRKLGLSSSREAARLLLAHETASADTENLGSKIIGVAEWDGGASSRGAVPGGTAGAWRRVIWIMIGALMLTIFVSLLIAGQSATTDSAAPASGLRDPVPLHPIPQLFAAADYPADANEAQGFTGFRVQVDATGRVEKCAIEHPSGSAALDEATCRVITTRARFQPALDKAGRPVAAPYFGTIQWRVG